MSGAVRVAPRDVVQVVQDHAHVEAEEAVHLAHPLGVAAREVVVHRHHVHGARERVQVRGQRGDQRLALAGAHLGDPAAVQHDARRSSARRSGAGRARAWRPRARSRTPRRAGRRAAPHCRGARGTPRCGARRSASESLASWGSSRPICSTSGTIRRITRSLWVPKRVRRGLNMGGWRTRGRANRRVYESRNSRANP
jgi:hypothetical protein